MAFGNRQFVIIETVILAATSLTSEIDLGKSGILQGIIMPSAWTAADLTFQVSDSQKSGGNFVDSYDDAGIESSVSASTSRHLSLYPDQFAGARYIKIRSGTTGTPVVQVAPRDLKLLIEYRGR